MKTKDFIALLYKDNEILCDDSGFYQFWPVWGKGYYTSYLLRAIADELDRKNAPWQAQIERDLAAMDSGVFLPAPDTNTVDRREDQSDKPSVPVGSLPNGVEST